MSLGGLLGGRIKKEAAKPAPPTALDELEQYLADTEEPTIDVKVLLWWKEKEAKWPNLAKMVKQYFAVPASSAGVERVFSAAGKMHGAVWSDCGCGIHGCCSTCRSRECGRGSAGRVGFH